MAASARDIEDCEYGALLGQAEAFGGGTQGRCMQVRSHTLRERSEGSQGGFTSGSSPVASVEERSDAEPVDHTITSIMVKLEQFSTDIYQVSFPRIPPILHSYSVHVNPWDGKRRRHHVNKEHPGRQKRGIINTSRIDKLPSPKKQPESAKTTPTRSALNMK